MPSNLIIFSMKKIKVDGVHSSSFIVHR